jgi:hypothetical protein
LARACCFADYQHTIGLELCCTYINKNNSLGKEGPYENINLFPVDDMKYWITYELKKYYGDMIHLF